MSMGILLPLVFAVVAIAYTVAMRKRVGQTEAQHSGARAGEIAQRLGIDVVEGDPNTNFMYARALTMKGSGVMPEVKIRLEGAPGGRHTAVYYYERADVKSGVLKTTHTTYIDARVVVAVHQAFPEFEIVLRDYGYFADQMRPELRADPCTTGDAQLDAQFQVKSTDARVGPVVADGLRNFLGWGFVHVIGKEGALTFKCTQATTGFLGQTDQIQMAFNEMAESLERVSRGAAAG